jgi:uncharacterized membrane protein YeiH
VAFRDWFPKYGQDVVLLAVDLVGTFVFAVEGALAGIRGDLDLLGLLVVSFVTALGGGTVRDLLIGAVPPNSIRDWRYGATAFAGGAAVFCFSPSFQHVPQQLMITLDAAGLALFAMAGAGKALEFGINPMISVLMGVLTGVGGGTIRDVLMARVPGILNTDIYASAALVGAAVMVIGLALKVPRTVAMTVGGVCCFVLRMVAVARHWNLPKVIAH